MIRSPWLRHLVNAACSGKDRPRSLKRRSPARLILESLEERLTPSGGQTVGSYNALTAAIAADTAANTNYVIDITGTFRFNSGGQVAISKLGSGSTLTIEGQNGSNFDLIGNGNCLFDIASGQNVTLKNLTLTEGAGHPNGNTIQGGAILDNGGDLVLSNVNVENNTVQAIQAEGGGLYVNGGSLTLVDCTIQSNSVLGVAAVSAKTEGGGVFVTGPATVQITDTVIGNNNVIAAPGANGTNAGPGATGGEASGGGLYVGGNGWNVTLTGDTLSGNKVTGGAGGNGAAGGATPSTKGNNGGAGGQGGGGAGGGAAFVVGSGTSASTLTILNDSSHPSLILDNTVQSSAGGDGGAGGAPYTTGKNSNGGQGGQGGFAQGGGVYISGSGGNFTTNIGNTTFYGNQVLGGAGGVGGAAGTGGSGKTGTAGSAGTGGPSRGVGLDIIAFQGNNTVTIINSVAAANTALAGLDGGGSVRNSAYGGGVYLSMWSTSSSIFSFDNNTITQNTINGGPGSGAAGVGFQVYLPSGGPPPATSGNLLLYNTVMEGNRNGSAADDFESISSTGIPNYNLALSNATNNFIGAIDAGAVSPTNNIIGSTQTQLGSAVGVDSHGNPTAGPIYYPLAFGVSSIGYGTTSVLGTIKSVEGTTSATDAIGNPMPSSGPIDLGAVQVVTASPSPSPSPPPPPPSPPSPPPAPPVLHVPPLLGLFDNLLGGVETVNANGTETITDRLLDIPLIVSSYDSQGDLESVFFLGINVTLMFELL